MSYLYCLIVICALISPQGHGCIIQPDENLKSIALSNPNPVSVRFNNIGEVDLVSYWIDVDGEENEFGEISVDEHVQYNTFDGHSWRIKTLSNDVVFEVSLKAGGKTNFEVGKGCREELLPKKASEVKSVELSDDYRIIDDYDKKAIFTATTSWKAIHNPPNDQYLQKHVSKTPCKEALLEWISRVLLVPGYHILCIQKVEKSIEIDAWTDGHNHISANSRQSFIGTTTEELREYIEELVEIDHSDTWVNRTISRQQQRAKDPEVVLEKKEYAPQPWRMFTTEGFPIATIEEVEKMAAKSAIISLVFEGGQFIYPGIHVGYQRQLFAHDRNVTLETLSLRPLVFSVSNFLDVTEYTHIIETSKPKLKKSEVSLMDKDTGKQDSEFRTSSTYFMPSPNDKYLPTIDLRTANLTRVLKSHQEYVQVLQYNEGERYGGHTDFWDIKFYSDRNVLEEIRGGWRNRLITVFWYMSACGGGYTAFPDAPTSRLLLSPSLTKTSRLDDKTCPHDFKVVPMPGQAIMFYSLLPDGSGDSLSMHKACPVTSGVKWAANKWVWNEPKNFL